MSRRTLILFDVSPSIRTRSIHILLVPALALLVAAGCSHGGGGEAGAGSARGGGAGGAGGGRGGGGGGSAFPVEVAPVESRQVEYAVNAVGSVEAFEIVQVTARVPGAVEKVHFSEGDAVKLGATLVEIDPERYRLDVTAARAALEKALAAKNEAEAGLARREGAVERNPGLLPVEEIETWRTRVRTAVADAAEKEAALGRAEMNERYAHTRAPFAGIIQTRSVQTGQYVQPGALLTTLVRREPLLLRFHVPEQDAARLTTGIPARFTVRNIEKEFSARITHVAESADGTSRMVAVTAEVDDPNKAQLRPGAFAEVVVPIGASVVAPVIPQTAVRPSERGFLAFVVEDGKAVERVLTLGLRTAGGLVEVRSGLAAGESLVVRGAEALRAGALVRVTTGGGERPAASGAESPATSGAQPSAASGAHPPEASAASAASQGAAQ
jgi:multidrug efflux system membrane fusion protein